MKLLRKNIDAATSAGSVVVIPEESEDMWHLYNLVAVGDRITAQTWRKIEKAQATGTVSKERRRVRLTIEITKESEYDAEGDELRFPGQNVEQHEHVALGAYHTISLELNEKMTIYKDCWDTVHLDILQEASDIRKAADTCVLLMDQAQGLAQFFFLSGVLAKVAFKVQVFLPKNRRFEKANFSKALKKFYEKIVEGIKLHVHFENIKCVVLAGPGFLKTEFLAYLKADNGRNIEALNLDGGVKKISEIFFEASCSTANKQGLQELLEQDAVAKRIASTKAGEQVRALDELYERLQKDPDRACYGPAQVSVALQNGAVQKLLVTDALFRQKADLKERQKYVNLVDSCRSLNGRKDSVVVFSSQHVTGEKLAALSGIAALLRYPVDDLSNYGSSDEEMEEEGGVAGNTDDHVDISPTNGATATNVMRTNEEATLAQALDDVFEM
ncbi:unnamed protein product [Amoebophrya sp. A120]|nr:unnamed protein product [Amoebophrya sp. A120]|eukprot:GSA120T00002164001.1